MGKEILNRGKGHLLGRFRPPVPRTILTPHSSMASLDTEDLTLAEDIGSSPADKKADKTAAKAPKASAPPGARSGDYLDDEVTIAASIDKSPCRKRGELAGSIFFLLFNLYFFLCGLGLMGDSFKVLAGKSAGNLFAAADHPIAGLMVGILATVLVQSSSTSWPSFSISR